MPAKIKTITTTYDQGMVAKSDEKSESASIDSAPDLTTMLCVEETETTDDECEFHTPVGRGRSSSIDDDISSGMTNNVTSDSTLQTPVGPGQLSAPRAPARGRHSRSIVDDSYMRRSESPMTMLARDV